MLMVVAELQGLIDAIRSPIRREILRLLWDRQRAAGEIASAFDLRPPTISEHLRVLREAGLVTMVVDGNFRRYRADQDALLLLRAAIPTDDTKWMPADNLPEVQHAVVRVAGVVAAHVDVPVDLETAYGAFADPAIYSRWLGVPVTIDDGRFSCTMEWGTRIRGRYEVQAPPHLIALRWDFEDDNVPVPGGEMVGYLRFAAVRSGSRVEVHQLCDDVAATDFMQVAWAMVLGRLAENVVKAVEREAEVPSRSARPKRIDGAGRRPA